MPMTFLFADKMDESGCVGLRLENDGSVGMPIEHRTFAEIQKMQKDSYTIVVLSTLVCGLHFVDLPWLGSRKSEAAIPYALEEQLAQPISAVHFAFDKAHHQDNRYLVVVIEKKYLQSVKHKFEEENILLNEVTVDWFALNKDEIIVSPNAVLARTDKFQGALKGELANTFVKAVDDPSQISLFNDSDKEWDRATYNWNDESFYLWIANRLQRASRINLCQGEFSIEGTKTSWNTPLVYSCIASFALWVVVGIVINGIDILRLNDKISKVDDQILVTYRKFFPGAQRVVSPKFQISQLINSGTVNKESILFWKLLQHLEDATSNESIIVERIDYRSSVLSVSLRGKDVVMLESLEQKLRKAKVKVNQTQATTRDQMVEATLELSL